MPWHLFFGNSYNGSQYQPTTSYSYNANKANNGGTIEGYVKNAEHDEPLIGVVIVLMANGKTYNTITDFNGFYRLSAVPEGEHNLKISYIGYAEQEATQIITYNNSTTHANFVMHEEDLILEEVVIGGSRISSLPENNTNEDGVVMKEKEQKSSTRTVASVASKTVKAYNNNTVKTEESKATINNTPTNIEFNIRLPYTVPNDGKTYTVDVVQYEVPATYRYYCTPKLDKDAFLTAEIQEWESLNLLNGEANLFFEGTFVGKSQLNPHQTADTLFLSLGRDKSIVVTRTKQKEYKKQTFLGNNKTETRTFDISVRNTKKQSIDLIIEDQYPIATDKDMNIDVETDREAERNETTGLVKWKLNVPPNQEKKLMLQYAVKYPRNKHLVLE